jgi:hypothetical protein
MIVIMLVVVISIVVVVVQIKLLESLNRYIFSNG